MVNQLHARKGSTTYNINFRSDNGQSSTAKPRKQLLNVCRTQLPYQSASNQSVSRRPVLPDTLYFPDTSGTTVQKLLPSASSTNACSLLDRILSWWCLPKLNIRINEVLHRIHHHYQNLSRRDLLEEGLALCPTKRFHYNEALNCYLSCKSRAL